MPSDEVQPSNTRIVHIAGREPPHRHPTVRRAMFNQTFFPQTERKRTKMKKMKMKMTLAETRRKRKRKRKRKRRKRKRRKSHLNVDALQSLR